MKTLDSSVETEASDDVVTGVSISEDTGISFTSLLHEAMPVKSITDIISKQHNFFIPVIFTTDPLVLVFRTILQQIYYITLNIL